MDDQGQAVATLALLTGVVMLVAGVLKLGSLLRFVSNAVLVGFMNAVGVNIVLGQLSNLTGYAAPGGNRVVRAINTVLSPAALDWRSVTIGVANGGMDAGPFTLRPLPPAPLPLHGRAPRDR